MIQMAAIPELSLTTHSIKKSIPTEDLFSMWNAYSKCKQSMENEKRLENRSWRLWHHESMHQHQQQHDTCSTYVKVSPITTIAPSSVLINSSISSHSTFGPQTPPGNPTPSDLICQHHHVLSDHSDANHSATTSSQHHGRRINKFYVDDSDDESDQDDGEQEVPENDGTCELSESLWSTIHDDHYLEEAYQRSQVQPVLSPPPRKENPAVHAAPLDLSPPPSPPATNQKRPCSLLSRLIQSSPHPPTSTLSDHHQHNAYDVLPPQLQSCVDWEKTQNSIRYRLGYALDLPNENIIW